MIALPDCLELVQVKNSDWEAASLDTSQINYAALHALMMGDAFRAFRALHALSFEMDANDWPDGEVDRALEILGLVEKGQGGQQAGREGAPHGSRGPTYAFRSVRFLTKKQTA